MDAVIAKNETWAWLTPAEIVRAPGRAATSRHVEEAVWVQAQLLAGRTDGLGCGTCLFAHAENLDAERDAFFSRATAQAEKGQIKVTVPRELVALWTAQVEKGQTR
jgi:hypothetical protein